MYTNIYSLILDCGAKVVGWENGSICLEYTNGTKEWYLNDKRHRVNGPAIEYANGSKHWYLNGQLHRTNGPAIEWCDNYKEWYLNGKQYTKEEFNTKQSMEKK